jgi:ribonucleotide reductase alpha subunit
MSDTVFQDSFSEEVWRTTYKDFSDESIDNTLRRVAKALASVEKTPELQKEWEEKFYDLLSQFKGTTGGRIMSNAGTEWSGTTLMNCFVGPRGKHDIDSLEGIYSHLLSQSQTLKSEGGWGENFSYIRPRGAFIHGIGVETPGAVKYMELFDKASDIITSGSGKKTTNKKAKGKIRKGAMMGVLECFSKDTILLTNKGPQTFEQVCTEKDPDLKAITENDEEYPIVDWIVNPPSQLYEVEDSEGNIVKVTAEHKFMVLNTETKTEYLKPLKDIDPETEMLIRME